MKTNTTRKINIFVIACIVMVMSLTSIVPAFAVRDMPLADDAVAYTDDGYLAVRAYQGGASSSSRIKIVPTNSAFNYITEGGECLIKRTPAQGLTSANMRFEVYYDFNGDGNHTADEFVRTETLDLPANMQRVRDIEVAKAAVAEYGTNSYLADMFAIVLYVAQNFDYGYDDNTYHCIGGAEILNLWNSYKGYDPSGAVVFAGFNNHHCYDGHDADGELFSIDCQGMKNKEGYQKWVATARRNMEYFKSLGM